MKNTKKVLAIILALTMVISLFSFTASATTYTDVPTDATYSEAVKILSALKILLGYEDGSFKPEGQITRAEFSAVICRALNLETAVAGAKGPTAFTDVPADHWASGYINMATQQSIILGYGDDKFGPEDPVTWEQAIKMIVASMGYNPAAKAQGGYPSGYLAIAAQKGILDNTSGTNGQPATRSTVAQLVYNALPVPLMVQTEFNADSPGYKEDPTTSLLITKLKVAKSEGVITANDYNNPSKKAADKQVTLTPTGGVGSSYYINGTDASDYLGEYVVMYTKTINNNPCVVAISEKANRNEIIDVASADEVGINGASDQFEYWIDKDKDLETTKLTVDLTNTKVFVNGELIGSWANAVAANAIIPNTAKAGYFVPAGDAKFVDNSNDDIFDYLFISKGVDIVVDEVSSKGRVSDKNGNATVTFDATDTTKSFSILFEGKEIKPADLQEDDVLTIFATTGSKVTKAVVSRTKVDGKITEVIKKSNVIEKYAIDGEKYELSKQFTDTLLLDSDVTVFLNSSGKIAYATAQGGKIDNYGFVIASGKSSTIDASVQIKMLTADKVWKTYNTATRFKSNGNSYESNNISTANPADVTFLQNFINKVVTYKLDDSGNIKEINYGAQTLTSKKYNSTSNYFGSSEIASNAVVFGLPSGADLSLNAGASRLDTTDVKIVSISTLENGEYYDVALFNNSKSEAVAVLIKGASGNIPEDAQLFIVKEIGEALLDGDEVMKITGYYAGGEAQESFLATDDPKITKMDYSVANSWFTEVTGSGSDIKPGSIIRFAADGAGNLDNINVVYNNGTFDLSAGKFYNAAIGAVTPGSKKSSFIIGQVFDKTNGNVVLVPFNALTSATSTVLSIRDCSYGKYDYVNARAYGDTVYGDLEKTFVTGPTYGSTVLIRLYDDIPEDVIILAN